MSARTCILLLFAGLAGATEIELLNGLVLHGTCEADAAQSIHSNGRAGKWALEIATDDPAMGTLQLYREQIHRLRQHADAQWIIITPRTAGIHARDEGDAPPAQPAAARLPFGWRADGNGVYPDSQAPTAFRPVWRAPLRSWAHASPIIAGDRILVLDQPHLLVCFDKRSGRRLWQRSTPSHLTTPSLGMPTNDFVFETYRLTTPTPVTDGNFVYASFGHGVNACYDLDGNLHWATQLHFGTHMRSGISKSPALAGDVLVTGGYGPDTIAGLDRRTGAIRWAHKRGSGGGKGAIVPLRIDGAPYALTSGGLLVAADGTVHEEHLVDGNYGPSPVVAADTVFMHDQKRKELRCLRLVSGAPAQLRWRRGWNGFSRSPLLHAGLLYVPGNKELAVLDAANGEDVTAVPIPGGWSSPIVVGDRILLVSHERVTLIATGRDAHVAGTFPHRFTFPSCGNGRGGTHGAVPVCDGNRWFFRDRDALWCLAADATTPATTGPVTPDG